MKQLGFVLFLSWTSAASAEPYSFVFSGDSLTVGEFIGVPAEQGYSLMSLVCFQALHPSTPNIQLDDEISEGDIVTIDVSCEEAADVPSTFSADFLFASDSCKRAANCIAFHEDRPVSAFQSKSATIAYLDRANENIAITDTTIIPAHTLVRISDDF